MTTAPTRVTAEQLRAHWMSADAAGLVDDEQRQVRTVRMKDGTEYETPHAELQAEQ